MALPSEGQLYSLLGQTTSSEYKRRQEEERKFRKSLRKDQMKAMLLQPLIKGAVGLGEDVLGNLFLPEGDKSFSQIESNRVLLNNLSKKVEAEKDLTELSKSLKKDERIDNMIKETATNLAREKGLATSGQPYQEILSHFQNSRSEFEIINQNQIDAVDQKLLELGNTYRSTPQIIESIKELDSTGTAKKLGRRIFSSKEEMLDQDRKQVFTGERKKSTIYDEEFNRLKELGYGKIIADSVNKIDSIDNTEIKSLVTQITQANPEFYGVLEESTVDRIAGNKARKNHLLADPDTLANIFANSPAGRDSSLNGTYLEDSVKNWQKVFEEALLNDSEFMDVVGSTTKGKAAISALRSTIENEAGKADKFEDVGDIDNKIEELYKVARLEIKGTLVNLQGNEEYAKAVGNLTRQQLNGYIIDYSSKRLTEGIRFSNDEFDPVYLQDQTLRSLQDDFIEYIRQNEIVGQTDQGEGIERGYTSPQQEIFTNQAKFLDSRVAEVMNDDTLTNEGKIEAVQELNLDFSSSLFTGDKPLSATWQRATKDKTRNVLQRVADSLGVSVQEEKEIYSAGFGFRGITPVATRSKTFTPKAQTSQVSSLNFEEYPKRENVNSAEIFREFKKFFVGVDEKQVESVLGASTEEAVKDSESVRQATINVNKKLIALENKSPITDDSTINDIAKTIILEDSEQETLTVAQGWKNLLANFNAIMSSPNDKAATSPPVNAPSLLSKANAEEIEQDSDSLLTRPEPSPPQESQELSLNNQVIINPDDSSVKVNPDYIASVNSVINRIADTLGDGANERAMIKETIATESNYGLDITPEGRSFTKLPRLAPRSKGLAQIDEISFEETQRRLEAGNDKFKESVAKLKKEFNVDFSNMTYDDLDNPTINLLYARLHYLKIPEKIPDTPAKRGSYWKTYYNTFAKNAAGTKRKFLKQIRFWDNLGVFN